MIFKCPTGLRRWTYRLLSFGLIFSVSAAAQGLPTMGKDQLAQLERGQILESSQKIQGSKVMMGKAVALIPDIPEAVAYVLLDLANYKNFLPRITESRITKRRGGHTYAVFETDLPWPAKDCWVYAKFTRYNKPGRIYEIRWWMINGTMKNYTGSALIEPWAKDTNKAVITYQLLAEPQTAAPDSVISNGVKQVASTVLQKIRSRLQALRKSNKVPNKL